MVWYKKLHWQIIIGLILGLTFGILTAVFGWSRFTSHWISPFGTIFLNLLKLIAVPLILASLITGIASLSDLKKLSRIGGKTIGFYVGTTVIALIIGLVLVNVLKPGRTVPEEMRLTLQETYQGDVEQRQIIAEEVQERGPLQFIVDMVPDNIMNATSSNRNMLQVVFLAIFMGIGLLTLPEKRSKPLLSFFESLNALIIKLVEIIMVIAPIGVFALIADTITSIAQDNVAQIVELLTALGFYCIVVVLGLLIQTVVTYPILLKIFTKKTIRHFFAGIAPVQLVAFSTSSSGATLPVTMEVTEKNLGVSEEVSSFVLPLGSTINMNGTAIYQAVSAVFIAQTIGLNLDIYAQLTIVLTALLASIGTAGVPSSGIVMLIVILEAIGIPSMGIALILGVERILDMCRTVVNVTGDALVAVIIDTTEGQIHDVLPDV